MKNPLKKRLLRELIGDFGKYAAIFLFMLATIGFVSGFLVASESMKNTYDESFEKYNIEDGHFVLKKKMDSQLQKEIEKENVTLYSDFYVEEDTDINQDGKRDNTLRIFGERTQINETCLLEGELPRDTDEIAIDRLYAENNDLEVGDQINVDGKNFTISGFVALSDYSALYQNNNDMMFDTKQFGVAVVTENTFQAFGENNIAYSYAWKYQEKPKNETKEKEVSEKLAEKIATLTYGTNEMDQFIPQYVNQSICFAGDDIGKDRPMITTLLYVLIVILAFVFAVTINHTVAKEATVIGTLRASGYTKGELFRHYLAMPILISLLAAILGNVLGYTVFVDVGKDMYSASYSLTTYESHWSADAFVKTTVVPMLLIWSITSVFLWKKLAFSPLQFLRRNLTKSKRTKAAKLPHFKFMTRFRLRIIMQNLSGYGTLFVGILFANLILMFGMVMEPLLDNYGKDAIKYKPANYQYILNAPYEIENKDAEKYCVTSLRMQDDYFEEEDINIYGLEKESDYYDCELPKKGVVITSDMAEKYQLEKGDIINLKEKYGDKIYAFEVSKIMHYPTCLGIYMPRSTFNEVFENEKDYYNGYFSDEKLEGEIDEAYIASCVTDEDLTKLSRQMDISVGEMFTLINVFAIVLFALLIYLLTKLILEKNTNSISMVKILGYKNGEIAGLYLVASVWVVILSAVIAMGFNTWFFNYVLRVFMKGYGGWFTLDISMTIYLEMFSLMVGTYLVVAVLQFVKIKKIPMEEALKNVE